MENSEYLVEGAWWFSLFLPPPFLLVFLRTQFQTASTAPGNRFVRLFSGILQKAFLCWDDTYTMAKYFFYLTEKV